MKLTVAFCGLLACGMYLSAPLLADEETETKSVKLNDLTLDLPTNWKQEEPSSRLRLGQFAIPNAEGDETKTELAVFSFAGGGGGVDANIKRWVGQFEAEGRTVKLTTGESTKGKYHFADLKGTYNMPIGPPIRRMTKAMPGSRMTAVILRTDDATYYLRVVGPEKTVTAAVDAFRKSFGANAEKEEEYKLSD